MSSNVCRAASVLSTCWACGIRDVVLCAGARNAPFVKLLSNDPPFSVYPFFDERSAGFFALGRAVSTGRPVVVITTSGTAVAELLPAVIEADYQGVPLLVISADRPQHYRGSGAPQTIEQVGLFSHYVEITWDLGPSSDWKANWSRRRPAHVNISFAEPLLDGEANIARPEALPGAVDPLADRVVVSLRKPLILLSTVPASARESVVEVLKRWRRPVYVEGPSHLRGHPDLPEVHGGERSLAKLDYDGVIRIGGVPTVRLWRDLENSDKSVLHFSHLPFSGLPRQSQVNNLASLQGAITNFEPWAGTAPDRECGRQVLALLEQYARSEPGWVHWLSRHLPNSARVFVGNSLPIREWDLAANRNPEVEVFANRGANGIDGLVSTFLGLARPEKSNWCVLGDLSALYDLNGLWPAREWNNVDLNIVILNNSGGKIFTRMFHNPLFENRHALHFASWAAMWGWEYQRLAPEQDLNFAPGPRRRIVEIIPDATQDSEFWQRWENL